MHKKIILTIGLMSILTGCSGLSYNDIYNAKPTNTNTAPQSTPSEQENTAPQSSDQAQPTEQEESQAQDSSQAKLDETQLNTTASELTAQMLEAPEISKITAEHSPVLYVATVNNTSSVSIDRESVTQAIANQAYISGQFTSLSQEKIEDVRQQLGLTSDDELASLSSAVEFGKMLGAKYMLFSQVSDDGSQFKVGMRMMELSSGLIIWSGDK